MMTKYSTQQDILPVLKLTNSVFYYLTAMFYFYLKLVLKIRHTQPFLKSPQPLDPTLKSEHKLSDRTRQTP